MGNPVDLKPRRGPKPGTTRPAPAPSKMHHPIMSMLAAEAANRGDTPTQLANHLGIGYVYLTQLLRGLKPTERLSRPVLVAAAHYLDVPVAQAYLWAGALEPTDFIHEGKFEQAVGEIFEIMSRHPDWGGFMPNIHEWNQLPPKGQLAMVLMFEKATGTSLTDKTRIPPDSQT